MILIMICSITLLATLTIFVRRAVEMRANRWHLYALRDQLRTAAYEDPAVLASEVFQVLDARLSVQCAHLDELSLWAILPSVIFGDRRRIENRQRDFAMKLEQP